MNQTTTTTAETLLKVRTAALFTAVAVLSFLPGAACASGSAAGGGIKADLTGSSTVQLSAPVADSTDFDALSVGNDPLFREGSKELLQQISKDDPAAVSKAVVKKPVLRDALNSGKSPAPKKAAGKKALRAAPSKIKNKPAGK